MSLENVGLVIVLAPFAFVLALFILPLDLWALSFRLLRWCWRAAFKLLWLPFAFLLDLAVNPARAAQHWAWWQRRGQFLQNAWRAVFPRP